MEAAVDDVQRQVDEIRARSGALENHLIDELCAGKINRREFVRRGSLVGVSLPMLGFLASACGVSKEEIERVDKPQTGTPKAGGKIRLGLISPAGALDPVTVNNQGGLVVLGQTGEYLVWSDRELNTKPRLAESWKPNEDGSEWTFKIRRGVKFHDGQTMTAEDVAASIDRLADPDNGSNALSAFAGVLSKGNSKAVDDTTVRFELDAPNGNFPNIVSSDNYNAIILPKNYDGDWEKTFIGTGPWKLDRFRPAVGVSLVKNREYWDRSRLPIADEAEVVFYATEQGQVLGFQGNEVDVLVQYSVSGGKALLTDDTVITTELPASSHRQIHMRTDKEPFRDKRVRQAMGLLVNRRALVDGLLDTKSDFGNDSPFAPVFKSTAKVAQREQDVAKAKQLLEAAGKGDGFDVVLETWQGFEMPDLAQLIQQDVRPAGIRIRLSVTDAASYYGDAVFGKSRWLDSTMGITEYGHRGVPNVLLGAPLLSKGTWNGAHFKNERYDKLVKDYTAALDLDVQRRLSRQIQEVLLDETPIMFTYFYYFLSGAKDYVAGVETNAMGHTDVSRAGLLEV
jgi:peptide/nickel transport system substrate-binding protein